MDKETLKKKDALRIVDILVLYHKALSSCYENGVGTSVVADKDFLYFDIRIFDCFNNSHVIYKKAIPYNEKLDCLLCKRLIDCSTDDASSVKIEVNPDNAYIEVDNSYIYLSTPKTPRHLSKKRGISKILKIIKH